MATLQLKLDGYAPLLRSADSKQVNYIAEICEILRRHPGEARPDTSVGAIGTSGQRAEKKVIFKMAGGIEALKVLEHEYSFYAQHLSHLQGTVIPQCYGLFKGTVHGNPFGCLVLERCEETPRRIGQDIDGDNDEFIRKFMVGLCKIHQAGVMHNGLSSKSHIIRQGREPRIIDFSSASKHVCRGAVPAMEESGRRVHPQARIRACPELVALEETIGVAGGIRTMDPVSSLAESFANLLNLF
ncbi:hypothetical protein BDZ97DRAFT_1751543 [Flammula alnicola]|nr:hypothetical protein BDZ97DRAFT_1751543 [Flammula alnicola]